MPESVLLDSPFYEPHPRLGWRDVRVVVRDAVGRVEDERPIDWRAMNGEERLKLEKLLTRVCH